MRDAGGQLRSRIFARASLPMVAKQIDRRNEFLSAYSGVGVGGKTQSLFPISIALSTIGEGAEKTKHQFRVLRDDGYSVRSFVRSIVPN